MTDSEGRSGSTRFAGSQISVPGDTPAYNGVRMTDETPTTESGDDEPDEPRPDPDRCPKCESADIHRIPKMRIYALLAVLLVGLSTVGEYGSGQIGFLLLAAVTAATLFLPRWRCRDCENQWD